MATPHWSERSSTYTATTTTAGPLKLIDFCPGVEYLMSQNKTTTTFLRVNLSDCGSGQIRHLSRQGVVYGVCQDLTTFCTQRIVAPQGICIKTREDCAFVNGSDAHMLFDDTVVQHSDAMFTCDDDTTTTHYTSLCDFIQGCPDGTDESFCEHPSCSGFLCSNGQCVLSTQRCNQHSDCLDDSDEIWCPDDPSYLLWFTDEARQQWVYVNLDGTGYFTQQVMTSDQTCPDTHYPCQAESLYCLPVYTRCNGLSDCVYGEDEQNCETVMCRDFYRCQSSTVCVHGDHLCDGWGQCPQRDDELMCDVDCPEGCLCQGHAFICSQPFLAAVYPHLRRRRKKNDFNTTMSRPPRRNIDNRTNISPDKSSRPSSPISGSSTSASGGGGGGGKRKGRGRDKRRNNRGGRSGRSRERDIESAPLNNPGSSSQAAKEESAALTSRTSQSTDEKKDAKKSSENSCSRWLWKSHKTTGEVFGFLGVITLIATVVYLMATNDEQKVRMVFGVIGLMIFAVFSFLFSWCK
ncbi:hypothetical protein ACOMHN_066486 [Nucella lapillus]